MRQTSQDGMDLLKHVEGVVLSVYLDSVGLPTVGVGHLIREKDGLSPGDTITQAQCDAFLRHDLAIAERAVDRRCPDLTQHQFDACTSLAYNIGSGAFENSTLARLIDAEDFAGAADQFPVWNRAGASHPRGLKIRRALERDLFLAPDWPLPAGWLDRHNAEFTS